MRLKGLLLGLFGVQVVEALYTKIPAEEIKGIVATINHVRRDVQVPAADMQLVQWDYPLQHALYNFTANTDPHWFFETPNRHMNGFDLMKLSPFKEQFPGYNTVGHDTGQNSQGVIVKIWRYRGMSQKDCFSYKHCNSQQFTGFKTCNSTALVKVPGQHCSYAYQYYPTFVVRDLSKIACVLLGIPGPFTPNHQPNSFWCYGKMTIPPVPANDQPYTAGKPCSKCPPDHNRCFKKLCV